MHYLWPKNTYKPPIFSNKTKTVVSSYNNISRNQSLYALLKWNLILPFDKYKVCDECFEPDIDCWYPKLKNKKVIKVQNYNQTY